MSFTKAPPRPAKQYEGPTPTARPTVVVGAAPARPVVSLPKREYLRSEDYRRWVASLNCAHCGRAASSQAAHSDAGADGKGMGIKADDSMIWPACADGPGRVGCHTLICSTGMFTREHSQRLAARYILQTQMLAQRKKKWPIGWAG